MESYFSARISLGKDFEDRFREGATKEIRKVLAKSYPRIQKGVLRELRDNLRYRITNSPEYESIIGGSLRGELGLPDGFGRISRIIDQWVDSIRVRVLVGTGKKLGSVTIGMINSDYSDVLGLPEAVLSYTNRRGKTISLEWLKWLLKEGESTIISEYDFSPSRKGRTGLGVMIQKRGGWKVPSQFSGVDKDNFVTRSFEGVSKDIEIIIRQELTKGIK